MKNDAMPASVQAWHYNDFYIYFTTGCYSFLGNHGSFMNLSSTGTGLFFGGQVVVDAPGGIFAVAHRQDYGGGASYDIAAGEHAW